MIINLFFILATLFIQSSSKFTYIDELEAQMNIDSAKDELLNTKKQSQSGLGKIMSYYNEMLSPTKTKSQLMIDKFIKSESKFINHIMKPDHSINLNSLLISQSTNNAKVYSPFTTYPLTLTSAPPTSRRGYSAVQADTFMIIFGGCDKESPCYNDLYFLDLK